MMDHQDINQIPTSQDQFKELTDMDKELLHTTAERLGFCRGEKTDAYLHGIQIALSQANRPIDNYFYRRIQENPQITNINPEVLFANILIVLMSDIAATVTQSVLKNSTMKWSFQGNRSKPRTLQHRPPQPSTTPNSQVFAKEGVVGVGCLIRSHRRVPGKRPPRDVSVSIYQIDGEQVGSQHRREGVSEPIPDKGKKCEGFGGEQTKSFYKAGPLGWPKAVHTWLASSKRLERFGEEAASPTTAGGVAAPDTSPVAPQKKN
ncbi:hypothetical protein AYI69_g6641 [Smittium culicis]|uniref:Uncharacterized protein n=1 Tax=Smittium culicis TaxID=133412 RepID=A0A1R1XXZ2_9FUNG|nr:hypothetical protein AYI69_g6641 [Smittium culicis]